MLEITAKNRKVECVSFVKRLFIIIISRVVDDGENSARAWQHHFWGKHNTFHQSRNICRFNRRLLLACGTVDFDPTAVTRVGFISQVHAPLGAHRETDAATMRMRHIVDQHFSITTVLHAGVQRRTQAQAREQGKNEFGVFHDN